MILARDDWRWTVLFGGFLGALCLVVAGCHDSPAVSGVSHPRANKSGPAAEEKIAPSGARAELPTPASGDATKPNGNDAKADPTVGDSAEGPVGKNPPSEATSGSEPGSDAGAKPAGTNSAAPANPDPAPISPENPAPARHFVVEGPGDALRIGFDDLDLLKVINMDPVTSDCVEKMPQWLRDLDGKHVRIRGYMKPSGVDAGIPEFVFVRSTDLCCFGPKGKVYHLIAVKLKPKTTTDYIELKPFDVTGKFRIEKVELDDGLIFLLYHIDDATIIRK